MSRECEGYIRHEEKQAVRETRTNNTPPSIIQDNKQLAHSTLTHSHVPLQSLCVCVGGGDRSVCQHLVCSRAMFTKRQLFMI